MSSLITPTYSDISVVSFCSLSKIPRRILRVNHIQFYLLDIIYHRLVQERKRKQQTMQQPSPFSVGKRSGNISRRRSIIIGNLGQLLVGQSLVGQLPVPSPSHPHPQTLTLIPSYPHHHTLPRTLTLTHTIVYCEHVLHEQVSGGQLSNEQVSVNPLLAQSWCHFNSIGEFEILVNVNQ